jgi:hypothetical protein
MPVYSSQTINWPVLNMTKTVVLVIQGVIQSTRCCVSTPDVNLTQGSTWRKTWSQGVKQSTRCCVSTPDVNWPVLNMTKTVVLVIQGAVWALDAACQPVNWPVLNMTKNCSPGHTWSETALRCCVSTPDVNRPVLTWRQTVVLVIQGGNKSTRCGVTSRRKLTRP